MRVFAVSGGQTGHRGGDPFMVQLWFLPYGIGQHLCHVKECLIARIKANHIMKTFRTMVLDAGQSDICENVHDQVVRAREQKRAGLIILTGDVGSLGVSLLMLMLYSFSTMSKVLILSINK